MVAGRHSVASLLCAIVVLGYSASALVPPRLSLTREHHLVTEKTKRILVQTTNHQWRELAHETNQISKIFTPLKTSFPRPKKRLYRAVFSSFALFVLGRPLAAHAAASTPMALGTRQIASAASLVTLVGVVGLSRLGLVGLAKQLLVACARCTLQLQLLGGLILQWLLPCSQPWWIGGWIMGVGILAAQESYGRLDYTYPALRRHLTLSFLLGGLSVLGFAVAFQLFGKLDPWYKPQTIIPVAGMLFGNTLSAAALAASSLTRAFATQQNQVELRLARGATCAEAVLPLTKNSIQTALTPTISALSVTGIVHLPGMMTGQILAGQSPRQAAIYQTLIWFLIASVVTSTVQVLNALVTRTLMDARHHRLRLDNLRHVKAAKEDHQTTDGAESAATAAPAIVTVLPISSAPPAFRVQDLLVKRGNTELSLDLHAGDRVGITGPSGIGKSQMLRTLIGLEDAPPDASGTAPAMAVHGCSLASTSAPEWRSKVCLVAQDRPSETGTPREFYEQVKKFRCQKQRAVKPQQSMVNGEQKKEATPIDMAREEWDLSTSVWDRPWSTLSGGEAQRASLAIAVALHPEVLLLDEATSALDEANTLRVEKTLKQLNVPMILVTHDRSQLSRFCTHHIDLSSETREAPESIEGLDNTSS